MRRRKMWKSILILLCLCGYCYAGPVKTKRNMPIMREDQPSISEPDASSEVDNPKPKFEMPVPSTLTLPSNATSIRADIMDGFKCDDRPYGYYADVENDCQIFHVCLPVTYADGKENTFRWSFICPEETIFSQDSFTCMRPEDMSIDCLDSQNYYDLNRNFGMTEEEVNKETIQNNLTPVPNKVHDEAISVFSDKTVQSDVVLAHSAPAPTIVKPDKPKRTHKPISSKPLHSIKSKPINLLPLRTISHTQTNSEPISDNTQPIADSTANHLQSFNNHRRRPVQTQSNHEVLVDSPIENIIPVVAHLNQNRRRPVQSNHETALENHNEKIVPIVPIVNESEEKLSSLKSGLEKGTLSTSAQNLGKLELPNANVENSETTELDHKLSTISDQSLAKLEFSSTKTDNSEMTKLDHKLPETQSTSTQNLEKLGFPILNTENTETANLDQTLSETEFSSTQNLGKLELSNTNAENSDTTKLVQELPELIPAHSEEESLNKKEETVDTQKVDEQTSLLNESVEELETYVKENESNDVVDDKKIETSQNSESFVDAPSIVEEHSEEIGSLSSSGVDTENLLLKEPSSVTMQEEEKDNEKALDANVDNSEVLHGLKNTPIEIHLTPEVSEVESDAVEEVPQVGQINEKVTSEDVESNQDDKEVANPIPENLDVDLTEDAKDTNIDNVESDNKPDILLTQSDDKNFKQSMGGFKPVDAEKAAEAEAIITDFLNTLRTTETANVKPINEQPIETIETDSKEKLKDSTENQETLLSTDELKETETGVEQTNINIDENKNTSELDANALKEENDAEKPVSDAKPEPTANNLLEELKNIVGGVGANTNTFKTGPIATYPIMNSFPSDMYQIPVKVIEAPVEEIEMEKTEPISQQNEVDETKETAAEVEVPPNTAIYTPLSIEDIVDLVKERLDQTPLEEKIKPMHLTVESLKTGNLDNPIENNEQAEPASINSEALINTVASAAQESEEIIMPIYHRLTESDISSTKTIQKENENESSAIQTESIPAETATADKSDVNMETENKESLNVNGDNLDTNLLKTKSSRLYRSRSIENAVKMDPRKRRFLFRSDAN